MDCQNVYLTHPAKCVCLLLRIRHAALTLQSMSKQSSLGKATCSATGADVVKDIPDPCVGIAKQFAIHAKCSVPLISHHGISTSLTDDGCIL